MLSIQWTQHAIERAGERFGFDKRIIIPNNVMVKVGLETPDGDNFTIRRGKVTYVCQRVADAVKVVTVYEKGLATPTDTQTGAEK
jgi:ubiquinone biosynthesis protein COQ9